jgi:hypothetical protein
MHSKNNDFWFSFFDEDSNSDDYADKIRHIGTVSRFIRPDWNIMLTPTVFLKDDINKQTNDLNLIFNIIKDLPRLMFDNDVKRFAQHVGFSNELHQNYFSHYQDHKLDTITPCRWDIINSNTGWQALELNTGGAMGGFSYDQVQSLYDEIIEQHGHDIPINRLNEHWHTPINLIADFISIKLKQLDNPRLIVVDDDAMYKESPLIANSIANALSVKLKVTISTVTQGEIAEVLNEHEGQLIIFEVFCAGDVARSNDMSYDTYFKAIEQKTITPIIDLLSELYMSKAIFPLLKDPSLAPLLSENEKRAINALIPDGYRLDSSLKETLITLNQHEWVLKPALGYGGQDVMCGWEHSPQQWQDLLVNALDQDTPLYVLQKRVLGRPENHLSMAPNGTFIECDNTSILGIFILNDEYCGGSIRQSLTNKGVINISKNAATGVLRSAE